MTTSSFSASSWTQLTLRLCSVEKEIGVIRLKADERVRQEEERVRSVAKRREELKEEFKREAEERESDYSHQLEFIRNRASRELSRLAAAKEDAERRIESADLKAQEAEQYAIELQKQVKRLYQLYDEAVANHDQRLVDVREETDKRVRGKLEESNRLVRDTGVYATQVQAEGMQYMADLEGSMKKKKVDLEKDALQRSRFKELYDVSMKRAGKITEGEYQGAKANILQEWHDSWLGHATGLVSPLEGVSPGFRDVSSSLSMHETIAAEDILDQVTQRSLSFSSPACSPTPDIERSKDRALSRAAEHKRDLIEDAVARPRTALF